MPAFDEIRFPVAVALGSSGGPERVTDVVTLASGREERNSRWANSRRRYDAGLGVSSLDDMHALIGFFEERRGRLHGFRWKDAMDWKSCPPSAVPGPGDQAIGIGDGATATFQLVKRYGTGLRDYVRAITKPVEGSVRVAVAGVEKTEGVHFTIDHALGLVTFLPGFVPATDQSVTAGFAFDVPVRFDTDRLEIDLASFNAGALPHVPVIEIAP